MIQKKIYCKDCKCTCCDNVKLSLHKGQKGINPDGLKTGAWLYVAGITWKKKKNDRWTCQAFSRSKRLCLIYPFRPPLCRTFQCKWAKEKKVKMPVNVPKAYDDNVYIIEFDFIGTRKTK